MDFILTFFTRLVSFVFFINLKQNEMKQKKEKKNKVLNSLEVHSSFLWSVKFVFVLARLLQNSQDWRDYGLGISHFIGSKTSLLLFRDDYDRDQETANTKQEKKDMKWR